MIVLVMIVIFVSKSSLKNRGSLFTDVENYHSGAIPSAGVLLIMDNTRIFRLKGKPFSGLIYFGNILKIITLW